MKAEFRLATIEDIEEIITLCNEVFEENTDVAFAKRVFVEEADKNQIYLVGLVDGKIVAHTKITIIPTIYQNMNTYAILNHVCVKPEYRRHNIATDMLIECEKICKEKGCVAVELWSKNFRQAAHSCYKKYGFEVVDAAFFSKSLR
ncbi:MAG: GNAT family N-acetyltransferase [Bacilli bacterium]|nr:GNAT family N-acetyltransferase [Bacilli bacterium]